MTTSADLPHEIIDLIFEFTPSIGLHVSRKYNDTLLISDSSSTVIHYFIHVHRTYTKWCCQPCVLDDYIRKNNITCLANNALSYPNDNIDKLFRESPKKYVSRCDTILQYLDSLDADDTRFVYRIPYFCDEYTMHKAFERSVDMYKNYYSIQNSIMDAFASLMSTRLEAQLDNERYISRLHKFYIFREQESIKKILDGSNDVDPEEVFDIIRALFSKD